MTLTVLQSWEGVMQWFQQLLEVARAFPPLRTAIVEPLDANSLRGSIEAAEAGLITPVLIGPPDAIQRMADQQGIQLTRYALEPIAADAPAAAAAARAVALACAGEVDAIMKGRLRTDELMRVVVAPQTGLCASSHRRMSHVFVAVRPAYPRPLLLTDAVLNIAPGLTAKRDIVQNAIDLAHALGMELPRVALLSAVEIVNPQLPSAVDAAALSKMADRGQITGGLVDGPLAFDDAVSARAAASKGIRSAVAGHADILVAPGLDTGNLLAKQMKYLSEAELAGVVVGGKVPIMLTSRADDALAHTYSCVLARLYVNMISSSHTI